MKMTSGWLSALVVLVLSAAPGFAQSRAAVPTVTVAGVRVVAPGMGEDGMELRAFNEAPGLMLALLVKPPAGAGIVRLDEDASTIESVTDDKGTNLMESGARLGSFPKISKDGSAGMIDIESQVSPAAGASTVKASGTLACTVAAGTKPLKVAKVALANGKTFKMGATTVTLGDVTSGEGKTNVTLNLPRSVLQTIKTVRFTDAKGKPLESESAGEGWTNDDAQISFAIQTAAPTANLVFDVWQGLKETKVPFTVETGIGLGGK